MTDIPEYPYTLSKKRQICKACKWQAIYLKIYKYFIYIYRTFYSTFNSGNNNDNPK